MNGQLPLFDNNQNSVILSQHLESTISLLYYLQKIFIQLNSYFIYLLFHPNLTYLHSMSTEQAKNLQDQQAKKGLWADISSDQEDSEPEKQQSDHQEPKTAPQNQTAPEQQAQTNQPKDKQQPRIKSFDPKKHLRGGFGNMKTVKGGFKPEKLEKKKFQLNTVDNPFDLGDQDSDEEEQAQPQETQPVVEQPVAKQPQAPKQQQKQKKKKNDLAELEQTLKEFGLTEAQEGDKKKKKKKPAKKTEEESTPVQQQPAAEVKPAEQPAEEFAVDKQKLQEIIKQKAKKAEPKKAGKPNIVSAALKAKQEREAKNKQKKVYLDL